MTNHLPSDQIRVVLLLPNTEMSADFKVAALPYCLNDLIADAAKEVSLPVPKKGTDDGSMIAREMLIRALEDGKHSDSIACLLAAWICLYGMPYLPGYGLQLKEMEEAGGHGVLRVYDLDELYSWQFDFTSQNGGCGGRREIPRRQHWSRGPMPSA